MKLFQAAREVGSKVSVSLPVEKYDETVLVGLKAQDEEGRKKKELVSVSALATDNNEQELTTDRSTVTKPSSLSPEPQPSGIRIVDERPTTFRAPATQGGG